MSTLSIAYSVEPASEVFSEVADACGQWWYESSFYANTGMEYVPDNPEFRRLLPLMKCLVGRDIGGFVASAYIGIPSKYIFNPEWTMMNELVWFIREDCRSVKSLLKLLSSIEVFMRAEKIDLWSLSVPSYFRKNSTDKVFSKYSYFLQDYKYIGVNRDE